MNDIEQKIIDELNSLGTEISTSKLAKNIGHSRLTVSKYLEIMKATGKVQARGFAQAKVWKSNVGRPKILIVDDEPHIANLIRLSLDSDKYELYVKHSGQSAYETMKQIIPDLVILDLMMPNMSGYDVIKKMKASNKLAKISIMVLSARAELKDKLKATDFGADDYLTKPFDPVELKERVKLMLSDEKHEKKLHPITSLLAEKNILSWINKKIRNDDARFNVLDIKIRNLDDLRQLGGAKRINDAMVLIAKLIKQITGNKRAKSVIGHSNKNHIIIVHDSNGKMNNKTKGDESINSMKEEISSEFKKILPFIYFDIKPNEVKNKIKLVFRHYTGKEILKDKDIIFKFLKE